VPLHPTGVGFVDVAFRHGFGITITDISPNTSAARWATNSVSFIISFNSSGVPSIVGGGSVGFGVELGTFGVTLGGGGL
jgi:hypothetical protein